MDRTLADVNSLSSQAHSQEEKIRSLEVEQASLNMTVARLYSADAREAHQLILVSLHLTIV